MRLTAFGYKSAAFYVAVLGAYLAAPYSNLFFLLLGFLTVLGSTSIFWTSWNLRGIEASVTDLDPVEAGSSATCVALIRDRRRRGAYQVEVTVQLDSGEAFAAQADYVEGDGSLVLEAPSLPRGIHAVRRASVSSTYPFGLFRVRRAATAQSEVVVYPEPSEEIHARSGASSLAELLGEQLSGAGDLQPSGMRDHREGDELRSVHWRATARRGRPVVREWEGGGGQGLEVLLDRRCSEAELEEALGFLSALVSLARTTKEVLAIHTQDLSQTYGEGHRAWSEALRFLARRRGAPLERGRAAVGLALRPALAHGEESCWVEKRCECACSAWSS